MRNKSTVINTIPPSVDYPMGRIKNDTGVNDGTPIVEENNGDIMETVTFFMNRSKTTPNGIPDNVTNGYQIANAIRETGGKFNTIYPATINTNKVEVPFRLDNIYEGEFVIVQFNLNTESENVLSVNKIVGTDGTEFTALLTPDQRDEFFSESRCIVERINNDRFRVYPIATMSVLENIYERLFALETNADNNMKILDSGVYIDSSSRASGSVTIPHDVVNVANTKVLFTCTRNNPMASIDTTTFSFIMTDRSVNQFRITFSHFPTGSNDDKLRVEWVLVNS